MELPAEQPPKEVPVEAPRAEQIAAVTPRGAPPGPAGALLPVLPAPTAGWQVSVERSRRVESPCPNQLTSWIDAAEDRRVWTRRPLDAKDGSSQRKGTYLMKIR